MRLSLSFLLCGLLVYVLSLCRVLLGNTRALGDFGTDLFVFLENLSLSYRKRIDLDRLLIDWPRISKKLLHEALVKYRKGPEHPFVYFSKCLVKEVGREST